MKINEKWIASYAKIYVITLIVMVVFNQFSYGNCYKMYCISAAISKLFIIAALVALGIKAFFYPERNDDKD